MARAATTSALGILRAGLVSGAAVAVDSVSGVLARGRDRWPAALPTGSVFVVGDDGRRVAHLCHVLRRAGGAAPIAHELPSMARHSPASAGVTTAAVDALASAWQRAGADGLAAVGGADVLLLAKAVAARLASRSGQGRLPPLLLVPSDITVAAVHAATHGLDAQGRPWAASLRGGSGGEDRAVGAAAFAPCAVGRSVVFDADMLAGSEADEESGVATPLARVAMTAVALGSEALAAHPLLAPPGSPAAVGRPLPPGLWACHPLEACNQGLALWRSLQQEAGRPRRARYAADGGGDDEVLATAVWAATAAAACVDASALGLTAAWMATAPAMYRVTPEAACVASWSAVMDWTVEQSLARMESDEEAAEGGSDDAADGDPTPVIRTLQEVMRRPTAELATAAGMAACMAAGNALARIDAAGEAARSRASRRAAAKRALTVASAIAGPLGVPLDLDAVDGDAWRAWHADLAGAGGLLAMPPTSGGRLLGRDLPREELTALVDALEVAPGTLAHAVVPSRGQLLTLVSDIVSGVEAFAPKAR